jgi:hypothetical protein
MEGHKTAFNGFSTSLLLENRWKTWNWPSIVVRIAVADSFTRFEECTSCIGKGVWAVLFSCCDMWNGVSEERLWSFGLFARGRMVSLQGDVWCLGMHMRFRLQNGHGRGSQMQHAVVKTCLATSSSRSNGYNRETRAKRPFFLTLRGMWFVHVCDQGTWWALRAACLWAECRSSIVVWKHKLWWARTKHVVSRPHTGMSGIKVLGHLWATMCSMRLALLWCIWCAQHEPLGCIHLRLPAGLVIFARK